MSAKPEPLHVSIHSAAGERPSLSLTTDAGPATWEDRPDYKAEASAVFRGMMATVPSGTMVELRRLFCAHPDLKEWDDERFPYE